MQFLELHRGDEAVANNRAMQVLGLHHGNALVCKRLTVIGVWTKTKTLHYYWKLAFRWAGATAPRAHSKTQGLEHVAMRLVVAGGLYRPVKIP